MACLLTVLLFVLPSWVVGRDCLPEMDLTALIQFEPIVVIPNGDGPALTFEVGGQSIVRKGSPSIPLAANATGDTAALAKKLDVSELISRGALRREAALMGVMSIRMTGHTALKIAIVVFFCFLLPGVSWIFARCLGAFVKTSIESLDQTMIGVDVEIGSLWINPIQVYMLVENVTIFNPEGYQAPYLMKIDKVLIDVDASALFRSFGKDIVVDELVFTGLDTIYAKKMFTSNFNDVMDFMDGDDTEERRLSRTSTMSEGDAKTSSAKKVQSGRNITLHKVRVEDVGMKMEMEIGGGVGPRLEVGNICYEDFSEEMGGQGTMLRSAISLLLRTILKSVVVTTVGKGKFSAFSEMNFLKSQPGGAEGKRRSSWFRNPWASDAKSS